jgi:hypothetical protein
MNIRISEKHFREIKKATAASFVSGVDYPPETGCLLLVGENRHEARPALLVKEVLVPEEGDLLKQHATEIVFSSRYLRRAMLKVRAQNLAGFVTVHTHPFSDRRVEFSPYDDAKDPPLMQNLYDLQPGGIFGSLVLGKNSAEGRIWLPQAAQPFALNELVIIGESLNSIPLNGISDAELPEPAEVFDRGLALTGQGALAKLSKMRVAVVGASGTGSLVAELLMRAGVGEIVFFEFDYIDKINLNRILHSRRMDAENRVKKAVRLAEALKEAGLPTHITIIENGDLRNEAVAAELRGCDFIFGCVDNSDWARLVMSEVAYQYLLPYIDLGTEIGLGKNAVQSVDSRVSYVAPGRACLLCSGIVSEERLRLEGLASDERQRVLAMGYTKDAALSAPAVMDLNMRASSYAVMLLRHLLQPFMDSPLPTHVKESLTNFSVRRVNKSPLESCNVCGTSGRFAVGDSRSLTVRRSALSTAPGN